MLKLWMWEIVEGNKKYMDGIYKQLRSNRSLEFHVLHCLR